MSIVVQHAIDGSLVRYGQGSAMIGTREWRAALEPGTFVPSDVTNGLIYGTKLETLTRMIPSTGTRINLEPDTDYSDQIFWCGIQAPRTDPEPGPRLHNVAIAGPRPDAFDYGEAMYCVFAADNRTSQWEADDVLIDPMLWSRADLNPPGGAMTVQEVRNHTINVIGIKGGYLTARNIHITNTQDAVQFTQSAKSDSHQPFSLYEHPWMDRGAFYRGPLWPSQPEGTHTDLLQIQIGRNLTLRGGLLGGPYDPVGYNSTPGYNSGYDAANALVMWKQENWTDPEGNTNNRKVDNLELDRVMFWGVGRNATTFGPSYMINMAYNTNYPNTFPNSSMHGCLFVDRSATENKYVIRADLLSHLGDETNRIISTPQNGTWTDLGPVTYSRGG